MWMTLPTFPQNFASSFKHWWKHSIASKKRDAQPPLACLANFASRVVFWNWGRSKFGRGTSSYKAKGSKTWTSLASVPGASFTFWISEFFFQTVDGWDIFISWLSRRMIRFIVKASRIDRIGIIKPHWMQEERLLLKTLPIHLASYHPLNSQCQSNWTSQGLGYAKRPRPHVAWIQAKVKVFRYLRWRSGQRFSFCWCYRNCRLATIRESKTKQIKTVLTDIYFIISKLHMNST